MTESNSSGFYAMIIIAVVMFGGGVIGFSAGYEKGKKDGVKKAKIEFEETIQEESTLCENKQEAMYDRGFEHGKAEAETDCKNQLSISDTLCKMDLKKAFELGKSVGTRSVNCKPHTRSSDIQIRK